LKGFSALLKERLCPLIGTPLVQGNAVDWRWKLTTVKHRFTNE